MEVIEEALACLGQQFGGGMQVDLRRGELDMAQVSGQSGKKCLNIFALAIPSQKSGAGEAVSQVLQVRTRTTFSAPQSTPLQNLAESQIHVGVIQPVACSLR